MTGLEIISFLKAFPAFVGFLKTAYADFIKLQVKAVEDSNVKYIEELHRQIAELKNAKTDEQIAIAIAALNSRR